MFLLFYDYLVSFTDLNPNTSFPCTFSITILLLPVILGLSVDLKDQHSELIVHEILRLIVCMCPGV